MGFVAARKSPESNRPAGKKTGAAIDCSERRESLGCGIAYGLRKEGFFTFGKLE